MPAIGTGLPRSAWSLIRTALRPSPWRSWSPTLSPRRRSALWSLRSAVLRSARHTVTRVLGIEGRSVRV